jgi:hypothetical protein
MSTALLSVFDPHFHVWDVSEGGPHDAKVLFAPDGHEVRRAAPRLPLPRHAMLRSTTTCGTRMT